MQGSDVIMINLQRINCSDLNMCYTTFIDVGLEFRVVLAILEVNIVSNIE